MTHPQRHSKGATITPTDAEMAREIIEDKIFELVSMAANLGMKNPQARADLARAATENLAHRFVQAIASTRQSSRASALEEAAKMLKNIPFSNNYEANRYDTDDEMVLHLWDVNGGESYDIRIKK